MSKLSERLGELMFYHNEIKSEELARGIGVTGVSVRGWLHGSHEISLEHAVALADYFHCSLEYLSGRSEKYEEVTPRELPPFYERLRAVMKEKGVTRYEFISKTRIKDAFFTNLARGEKPKLSTVCTLADRLQVTLDYLIGRTDD